MATTDASSRELRLSRRVRSRCNRNAAATATLTTMISNETPYTPVTVAIRANGMLSTSVTPNRSQGNPKCVFELIQQPPTQMERARGAAALPYSFQQAKRQSNRTRRDRCRDRGKKE